MVAFVKQQGMNCERVNMKPDKALNLVLRYSFHVNSIKSLTAAIGNNLDACKGINGNRQLKDEYGCLVYLPDTDSKGRDKGTHLWNWYQQTWYNLEYDKLDYEVITEDTHKNACPHCYAAHIAIQERKEHRKKLGYVKGAMTKAIKGE